MAEHCSGVQRDSEKELPSPGKPLTDVTCISSLVMRRLTLWQQCSVRSQRPSNMLHAERCLTEDEWRIAQHEIDWNVEGYFGYTRLDCHRCYGGPTAVSNILPRYVSIEQGWRAIGQGGMRISPNRKGGAASTNEPKVQGRTKQSTAEKTDKSMKQATIRRSSAMADSNRGSSVTQKVKENFQLKKKDLVH